jgi:hypothetical protein
MRMIEASDRLVEVDVIPMLFRDLPPLGVPGLSSALLPLCK